MCCHLHIFLSVHITSPVMKARSGPYVHIINSERSKTSKDVMVELGTGLALVRRDASDDSTRDVLRNMKAFTKGGSPQ